MPWFLCFQSFGISYLEVCLSLSWEVLCLVWNNSTWIGSHRPQEEEVSTLRTSCQGQGQGQSSEVEMSSIARCFGCTLSAQIKQQSSTSGGWYFRASALEMEKEECWSVFSHVGIETFYPLRILCNQLWFSTSASITENLLQSWLPPEGDQVGAGLSCSTSW